MEKDTTKFDLELYYALNLLNECQMNTQKKLSCIGCVDFFVCNQRKDYVNKVYNSMSKGKSGNFEFN